MREKYSNWLFWPSEQKIGGYLKAIQTENGLLEADSGFKKYSKFIRFSCHYERTENDLIVLALEEAYAMVTVAVSKSIAVKKI